MMESCVFDKIQNTFNVQRKRIYSIMKHDSKICIKLLLPMQFFFSWG